MSRSFDVAGFLAQDKPYTAAVAKQHQLQHQLLDVERRGNVALGRINGAAESADKRGESPLTKQARALIAGQTTYTPELEGAHAEYEALTAERRVLREAVRLATLAANDHRDRITREAAAVVGPEHKELVRKVVAAVVALENANAAEIALRDKFGAAGLGGYALRNMRFGYIGSLADFNSRISAFLGEAVDYNFLSKQEAWDYGLRDSRYKP